MPKLPKEGDEHSLREDASTFLPEAFFGHARFREAIDEFVASWDAAEAAIKEAELFRQKVVFASIKELRYAGRRFADALKLVLRHEGLASDHDDSVIHLVREASENCIRARNDAVDALIAYLHKYFDKVKEDYGTILMNAYFPEFTQLFVRLNELGRVLPASRSNERDLRNTMYERIVKEDIPLLRVLHERIETSKNLIDEDTKRERKKQRWKDIMHLSIGSLGVILTAIGLILTLRAL